MAMELPDEAIQYSYGGLTATFNEEWTLAEEMEASHFVKPEQIKELIPQLTKCRSNVLAQREGGKVPEGEAPPQPGFIDRPTLMLADHRRHGEESELGKILRLAARFRDNTDRVVVVGIGGSYMGARALFEGLCHTYHNQLPRENRLGTPRIYFEGITPDNDALYDLLELLQVECVDPDQLAERWGAVVISKSGGTLEPAAVFRILQREALEYYGKNSPWYRQLFVAITGKENSKLRDLFLAQGHSEADMLEVPEDIGGRFSVLTPVGLLPAAIMGLDVSALLLGAAAMTKRFLEEPFERNPVLQYAAVNHLLHSQANKPLRVMSVWSRKLEAVGLWYDQLLSESLGKRGRGPTPLTIVQTRDLHSRGQQHQDGPRDRVINNVVIQSPNQAPIDIGMADHDQDNLNRYSRKTFPDLMNAAWIGTNQSYYEVGRPTADILLPTLSEHTMGQLLQMLMLATIVEGHLMGINPYGQPGVESYKHRMGEVLDETSEG